MSIAPIGAVWSFVPSAHPTTVSARALPENIRDGSLVIDTYGGSGIAAVVAPLSQAPGSSSKPMPLIAAVQPVDPVTRGRRIDVYA